MKYVTMVLRGTRADQPVASTVAPATLYYVTDESVLERSSGSAWESYSAAAGGGGDFTLIQQIVTSGSQATVDFTSIPASYSALVLDFFSRDTQAGTAAVVMRLRLNNDTTAGNYTGAALSGIQNGIALITVVAASALGIFAMGNPQNGNTAGITNAGRLIIPGYAGTLFHKRMNIEGSYDEGTNGLTTVALSARWASTAAVNRLTFATDGTAFLNGSTFTLYGQT